MLEDLNAIPWSTLSHAEGPAVEIPQLLRAIAGYDSCEQQRAVARLSDLIAFQGFVFEATAPTIPFLLEIIDSSREAPQAELLELLGRLTEGHSYLDVNAGLFSTSCAAYHKERAEEEGWVASTQAAVEAGRGVYLRVLEGPDPELATSAAFVLGHCRGLRGELLPRLSELVYDRLEPAPKAALLLAIANLEGEWDAATVPVLTHHMAEEQRPVVRLAAALARILLAPDETPVEGDLAVMAECFGAAREEYAALPWCVGLPLDDLAVRLGQEPELAAEFLLAVLEIGDIAVVPEALAASLELARAWRPAAELLTPAVARWLAPLETRAVAARSIYELVAAELPIVLRKELCGTLAELLQTGPSDSRAWVRRALARLGDDRVLLALRPMLADPRLRREALPAISELPEPQLTELRVDLAAIIPPDEGLDDRRLALVERLGEQARAFVRPLRRTLSGPFGARAARVLGRLPRAPQTLRALREASAEGRPAAQRCEAARALQHLGEAGDDALAYVERSLSAPSPADRARAARARAAWPGPVPGRLRKLIKDSHEEVRIAAIESIMALEGPGKALLRPLFEALCGERHIIESLRLLKRFGKLPPQVRARLELIAEQEFRLPSPTGGDERIAHDEAARSLAFTILRSLDPSRPPQSAHLRRPSPRRISRPRR